MDKHLGRVQRKVDWKGVVRNVIEGYPYGIPHGLQKDAIQNGWDACPTKTKNYVTSNWKMRFELLKIRGVNYLVIQDYGTTGLTGEMTSSDYSDDEMPPETERWAKWESYASGKTSEDSLGERGQGKMLYAASSKKRELYYDSIRGGDNYRAGWTNVSTLDRWDGSAGRSKIAELGLPPLNHQGSRFIIVEPIEEVVSSITSGEFANYIAETWWPLILKRGALIEIVDRGKSITVRVPERYPIGEDQDTILTWHDEKVLVKTNRNKDSFRIKNISLCYQPDVIENTQLRGVGVYRGGMRVPTIQVPRRDLRGHIYGHVELGDEIDSEIRHQRLEHPNHYDFKDSGVWNKCLIAIEDAIDAFINGKLSGDLSDEQKKHNQRTSAQNRALAILRNVTKGWPLSSTGVGPGGTQDDDSDIVVKNIGVRLSKFNFPNPGNIPRLNYGESIPNYFATGFNKTLTPVRVQYTISLFSGDRVIEMIDQGKVTIEAHKTTRLGNEHSLLASPDLFPDPGQYRIKVTMIDAGAEKKTELDSISRRIWVEEDPDLSSPFDIKPRPFSEMDYVSDKIEWFLNPIGSGKYELYYNLEHPTYLKYENDDQPRYLAEIFAEATIDLLIRRLRKDDSGEMEKNKNLPFDPEGVLSKDPERIYKETSSAISKIRYDIDELLK